MGDAFSVVNQHEGSDFVRHIECNSCGSSDANSLYTDGHTHCFACTAHTNGEQTTVSRRNPIAGDLVADVEVKGIRARKITDETSQKFGYGIGEYKGKQCQVAPYYDAEGNLVAQKLRFKDKEFKFVGKTDLALPFGAHAWQKTGKSIVVTEGEIDALSMSQAQGNQWPVVSIGCGADNPEDTNGNPLPLNKIRKYFAKHRDYFMGFEKVVLMFDSDKQGRASAQAAASVLGRRAHIAELPEKDANDMLVKDRVKELIDAMWRATPYRPEGIVELSTLAEQVKTPPEMGLSFPWESLTKLLYGIRVGMCVGLGAGVGSGKTDFYTQIATHLVHTHGKHVGMFYLETPIVEIAQRMAGKIVGKPFHIPDSGWTEQDFDGAWKLLTSGSKVFLYDNFGNNEWEPIRDKIEYLYHAEGVQHFFIDHLTALAAWQEDERKALEVITSEMGGLVKKLPITIFFVSHLATPEGKPHEEGGRVYARHFKGSRSIIQWATDLIGLERDQQAEDERVSQTTTVRLLKQRLAGIGKDKTFSLLYDRRTGLLNESSEAASTYGFGDTPQSTRQSGEEF